ncbi:MAG: ABC transporter substrate-binding protein [Candidatus Parvarchaeota archaeon]|nr:ABC transporter substrate-binding protein [Candidatus Jingweiarchaeum tengchongense]MCW1310025.1 ABC transporter substrate-binding protein [Candidatus Jingweiarchaeum tengchongense]
MKKALLVSLLMISLFVAAAFSTTLTVWIYNANGVTSPFATTLAMFQKANPNIQLKITYEPPTTTAYQTLITSIMAGNPPDVVMYFDRFNIGTWAAQGYLTPLTAYIKNAKINLDEFYPFTVDECTYNGQLYGLPMNTDSRAVYYSIPLLKKLGIPLPSASTPLTWNQFEQYIKKATTIDPKTGLYNTIGWDYLGDQGVWFYTWAWQAGVKFYDSATKKFTFDSPAGLKVMNFFKDVSEIETPDKLVSSTAGYPYGLLSMLQQNKLAFFVDGVWDITTFDMLGLKYGVDYGITPLPIPEGGHKATWSGGFATVIPTGAKNIEDGFKLVEYMSIGEGAKYYDTVATQIPAVISEANTVFKNNPAIMYFVDQLEDSHCRPVVPVGSQLWNYLSDAVSNVVYGKMTPQTALTWAQTKAQTALDQFLASQ